MNRKERPLRGFRISPIQACELAAISIVLAISLAFAGCSRPQPIEYWFVDSLTKVFPDDAPGTGRLDAPSFAAARNANAGIQLALRAPRAVGDLYVDALPLTGPGAPIETVKVGWIEYVVVTTNTPETPPEELVRKAPALFPDVVMDEFPITVSKGQTRSIWLTVHVPANQEPGEYQGRIRLRQGGDELAVVPYALQVYPATVPAEIPLTITNYFNLSDRLIEQFYGCSRYSEPWWRLIRNIAQVMGSYHQTSIGADPVSLVTPEVRGGALYYDFGNFERFVETFTSSGVNGHIEGGNLMRRERRRDATIMVPSWIVEDGRAVRRDLPETDPRARRFLGAFLPALHQCLERNGWVDKYVQGILDEPNEWERDGFVRTAMLFRRLMPGVRTIEPVGIDQDLEYLKKTVDIWVPHLRTLDGRLDVLQEHVARGGEVWFYTALSPRGRYPNRFIDYSLLKVRLLHWINFKYDFGGFLHWGGNYWGPEPFKDTQPVINQGRTYLPPGDAYITYPHPAARSIRPSIRLEQMRAGIEDFGLLSELAKRDQALADEIAGEVIQSLTDYVRDPKRFREIHRKLLGAF